MQNDSPKREFLTMHCKYIDSGDQFLFWKELDSVYLYMCMKEKISSVITSRAENIYKRNLNADLKWFFQWRVSLIDCDLLLHQASSKEYIYR